jgi:anhydro-N-acetylmuramic acid kinase
MQSYQVIGLMSGSSMDGVDLACCEFSNKDNSWEYRIIAAETIPYDEKWRVRLSQLYKQPIDLYAKTDAFFGRYLGILIKNFIQKHQIKPQLVASHGHTIFHQPLAGFTAQIGDGAAISAMCGLPVVNGFRNMDLAFGGQGAPLVPVGDKFLFPKEEACLNLGGIANISFSKDDKIKAFDISPCNIVMNRIARWLGQSFDAEGRIAATGEVDPILLNELEQLDFYQINKAKSLGREWINAEFWPIIKKYQDTSEEEKMATIAEHIALRIAAVLNENQINKVLVTGGGTFNSNLIKLIQSKTKAQLVLPDEMTIHFKEALIFAFLGVLRIRNEENVWSEVTGGKSNHIGGALWGNFKDII